MKATIINMAKVFGFLILITTSISCTRESARSSKIKLTLPALSTAPAEKIIRQSTSSTGWGIDDPTSLNDISCYIVFVSGPEAGMKSNTCKNTSSEVVATPGLIFGSYGPGKTIEVDLPSGSERVIQVLGLRSQESCPLVSSEWKKSQVSRPYIIGESKLDLVPGKDEVVVVNLALSTDKKNQIDNCQGPGFNHDTGTTPTPPSTTTPIEGSAPTVTSISPSSGSPSGGTLVTIIGSGFAAGTQVFIGGNECTSVTIVSATQLTCITASHSASSDNDVTLSNGTLSSTLASAYDYVLLPLQVLSISSGSGSSCAMITGGRIKCWGYNSYGEVGASLFGNIGDEPWEIGNARPFIPLASISLSAIKITTRENASCAILSDNSLRCWGSNNQGLLGLGSTALSDIGRADNPLLTNWGPVDLSSASASPVETGSGAAHTCALMNNGTVWCWGMNSSGQLGNGSNTASLIPVQVSGITSGVQLAVGYSHNCVRLSSGGVKCWGGNSSGQLGNGTVTNSNTPVVTSSITSATDISVSQSFGGAYSCAVNAGALFCWGNNGNGQLGDGTTTNRTSPTAVSSPMNSNVSMVRNGNGHSCGVKNDGSVFCWGLNSAGQLGHNSTTNTTTPTAPISIAGASSISLGDVFSCAVINNQAKCWGFGVNGQLAQGNTDNLGDSPGEMEALPFIDLGSE